MVGIDFEGREDCCDDESPQVFASIGQHDTGYHWGQIGQGHHLPDVARGDDDEEIAAESPDDTAQYGQILTEVEGSQQNIESQQIGKHQPHIFGKPEVIDVLGALEQLLAIVGRRHLIGWHTAEDGVGPAGLLAGLLLVLYRFLAGATSCRGVVTIENATVEVGRHEIDKSDDGKQYHRQDVGKTFLQCIIHSLWNLFLVQNYKNIMTNGEV